MDEIKKPEIAEVFNNFPKPIRQKLLFLRQLILQTAAETEAVNKLEETLKWGQPSYLTKGGSTIRLGYKKSNQEQYALYFHCQTKLVDTFKELYRDQFKFEGNRAIVFDKNEVIPIKELAHCISLSLRYHSIKHLSMLGVGGETNG